MMNQQYAEELHLAFLKAFVSEPDNNDILSYITEDFCCIGLLSQTPVYGKTAFETQFKQIARSSGIPLEVVTENMESNITDSGDVWTIASVLLRGNSLVQTEREVRFYQTAVIRRCGEEMKIAMLHSSMLGDTPMKSTVNSGSELIRRHYKMILDAIPMLFTITDNDLRILFINKYALDLLHKSLWECIGKPCCDIWTPYICGTASCAGSCLKKGSNPPDLEIGGYHFKLSASYLKDLYGNPIGIIEVGNDVTEIKKANEKFASLSASIPGGVCEIAQDEDLTVLYGNDGFYRLLGYTREQFLEERQNKLINLLDPDEAANWKRAVQKSRREGDPPLSAENRIVQRDGSITWILVYGTPINENTAISGVVVDITERKRVEQELRVTEERLRAVMEKNSSFVFEFNIRSKWVVQPDAIADLYGIPCVMNNMPESMIERGVIHEDSHEELRRIYREICEGQSAASAMLKTRTADYNLMWIKMSMTCIYNEDNEPIRAIGLIEDITKEKKVEMAYFQEEQYRTAMLSDVILYLEMDLTHDTFCKRKGKWNFTFESEPENRYSRILEADIQNSVAREYQEEYRALFTVENALTAFGMGRTDFKLDYPRLMEDGKTAWVQTTMTLVKDLFTGDIKGFLYVRDIDRRKRAELRLQYASQHDSLTGSFNKSCTETMIQEILKTDPENMHAFLILDIDYFKKINDTYGHFFGDQVLRETAQVLQEVFRSCDVVGRIGGDEFAVLVRAIPDLSFVTRLTERICERFHVPMSGEKGSLTSSCSIGISVYPTDGTTFEQLYRNADSALYQAKMQGRNQFVQYHPQIGGAAASPHDAAD